MKLKQSSAAVALALATLASPAFADSSSVYTYQDGLNNYLNADQVSSFASSITIWQYGNDNSVGYRGDAYTGAMPGATQDNASGSSISIHQGVGNADGVFGYYGATWVSAWARQSYGEGMQSTIDQFGTNHSASTYQGGNHHQFTIQQTGSGNGGGGQQYGNYGGDAGGRNVANIVQRGSWSGAWMMQSGTGNFGSVEQNAGTSGSYANVESIGNNNRVGEGGEGAFAGVQQDDVFASQAFVQQGGWAWNGSEYVYEGEANGNAARVVQANGEFLTARVKQFGDVNNATVSQTGAWSDADVTQRGSGHYANTYQQGDGAASTEHNLITLSQSNTGNFAYLSQYGHGNTQSVAQTGTNGMVSNYQSGSGNLISVSQAGFGHYSGNTQMGTGNSMVVSQR